jgi:uncharacterized protein YigE (DUF2233 family)
MGYRLYAGQALRKTLAAPLLAVGLLASAAPLAPVVAAPPSCTPVDYAGNRYTVCIVDLTESDLRLFWQDPTGQPYETFRAVETALSAQGQHLAFAMNAGMFNEDNGPVGLYIENGAERVAANTNEGPGNFHLMPNGIFYWSGDTAGVMETHRFLAERPAAAYATQSGPMLLIDGAVHPRFLPDSDSRKIRNGVGIINEHTVAFAISENSVTFYDFALLFRDRLEVRNALFLDGSVSALYAPMLNRAELGWFGPIVGVVER